MKREAVTRPSLSDPAARSRSSLTASIVPLLPKGHLREEQGMTKIAALRIIWRAYCPRASTSRAKSSFSLLAQELGRTLTEFRVVRQPIERIPPQRIRADRVFLEAG